MIDNISKLYFKYGLAAQSLDNQIKILNNRLQEKLGNDNPIEHLKYRIKSDDSIQEKLIKLHKKGKMKINEMNSNYIFSAEEIEEYIDDVVGYRIVCPFLSDVYKVVEVIEKSLDIEIVKRKDYIKEPKRSGYSSYHLKVLVPIEIPGTGKIEKVKAEIQVRTITMDMLASLEHKIKYKKNVELPEEMQEKLTKTVKYCNYIDKYLDKVFQEKIKQVKPKKEIFKLPKYIKIDEYKELINERMEALKVINNKLQNSYIEDDILPIEHTKYRIKEDTRIIEKLNRTKKLITFENIKNHINDIAGVRIVCPFLDDVNEMIELIRCDSELEIIEEQDYITCPKDSGYISYHMLVNVPIEIDGNKKYTKVEIQFRTITQEMWAILQERLCYQKESDKEIIDELKNLSNILSNVDYNMNEIIKYSRNYQKNIKKKMLVK